MVRKALTDDMWEQFLVVLKKNGCRNFKNSRNVIEAILWKMRTGAPWREIPPCLCPWKTAFNRFNRWAKKGLWNNFFLLYEEKLMKSGYSSMEAMLELTRMRVELGLVKKEQLESHVVDLLQKSTWWPTRMEIRFILKSLGVKFTTLKLRESS